jgi:catechol 2,3-dioxygenase-like lactoylglutathione lyase family enzyme
MHHVALETRPGDADACVAFFALLGFSRVEPPESLRDSAVWVQRGTYQVHLLLTGSPDVPPKGHVAFVADEYEADTARLRSAGHRVEERRQHWGSPRCFAYDPAGHRVELMAFPPASG